MAALDATTSARPVESACLKHGAGSDGCVARPQEPPRTKMERSGMGTQGDENAARRCLNPAA